MGVYQLFSAEFVGPGERRETRRAGSSGLIGAPEPLFLKFSTLSTHDSVTAALAALGWARINPPFAVVPQDPLFVISEVPLGQVTVPLLLKPL